MTFISRWDTWERRARQADRLHQARVALARSLLVRVPQDALAAVAEAAIEMMDHYTDPDEDHCLAGDDGCGAFIVGGLGIVHWGSSQDAEVDHAPGADYGVDQRIVPLAHGEVWHVD